MFDLLKGIAVLLMIQVHVMELFASYVMSSSTVGKLSLFLGGAPVTPLFMVVFGYFIAQAHKSTQQLLVRGIKIFLLGMVLNMALNFNLMISVYHEKLHVDVLPYIFGVDILHFAGIALVMIAPLKKTIKKRGLFILVTMLVIIFLSQYALNYAPNNAVLKYTSAFFYGSTQWSYFPLFPWLAYPLTGMAIYQLQQRYPIDLMHAIKTNKALGVGALLFVVLTLGYAIRVTSDLPTYYHHGILFFLWVIVFLTVYSACIYLITEHLKTTVFFKYLTWLGKHVTLIYIIQWIIIGNIGTEIYKSITSLLYLALCFIGLLGVSSGICFVALKLKERLEKK